MTTIAGPRPTARGRAVIENRPLRNPDISSRPLMTRRGWWLVIVGFLIPGSAQVLAGNRKLGRFGLGSTLTMWLLLIVGAGVAMFAKGVFLWLVGQGFLFTMLTYLLQVAIVGYAILWIVLALNTLVLVKLVRTGQYARFGILGLSVLLMVVTGSTAAYAANSVAAVRETFSSVFGASAAPVEPSDGYYNILLLGADSGDGRDSMRFDSISVVSINADTGKATITGIPRDMKNPLFAPGPMHDLYPDGHQGHADAECGWTSAINQLNTELEVCRDGKKLYPDAIKNGSTPGIEATKDAAEGTLGITIPYYVFIDMDHFAQLIDALGGVDIDVKERLPEGGGPPEDDPEQSAEIWATGWIEPGKQHMNGETAQWYARSRYTTSDWDRMRRQRELQEAMLSQFTPQTVLTRFQELAKAGTAVMETDVPQAMLPTFLDLALKAKSQPVTSIELNSEGTPAPDGYPINPDEPDFDQIHALMQAALHPDSEDGSGQN
ncbi:LCP family protein [Microbacterium gorillae]|uniref:LCP family protein n=1 Tax=Microbacterium gorillae TaxID=1231063 RepID=UPI00058B153B|nr:LCP family protein [Microbacterium gorillae]